MIGIDEEDIRFPLVAEWSVYTLNAMPVVSKAIQQLPEDNEKIPYTKDFFHCQKKKLHPEWVKIEKNLEGKSFIYELYSSVKSRL